MHCITAKNLRVLKAVKLLKLSKCLRENFRLLKLIHSSDETKIWLVDELSSSRKFLLKVINRTGLLYSQIAGIKNTALSEFYHVEENGAETYVVEEFLQGIDLQAYLELRGSLDEQTVARLAIENCDGLSELYHWHIVQRDIKPSNLFLPDAENFNLIDFDAARLEKLGQTRRYAHDRRIRICRARTIPLSPDRRTY